MASDIPHLVHEAGEHFVRSFTAFFLSEISNLNTRDTYRRHIEQFFFWCQKKGYKLDKLHQEAFLEYITERGGMSTTVEQQMAALRRLFYYFVSADLLLRNPVPKITRDRSREQAENINEELQRKALELIRSIEGNRVVKLRDRVLLSIIVFTNIRITEIRRLLVKDYLKNNGGSNIRYTNHLSLDAPYDLPAEASTYIDAYLEETGIKSAKETPLLRRVKRNGELSEKGLSRGGINAIVKQCTKESRLFTGYKTPKELSGLCIQIHNSLDVSSKEAGSVEIYASAYRKLDTLWERPGTKQAYSTAKESKKNTRAVSPGQQRNSIISPDISVWIIEDHDVYRETILELLGYEEGIKGTLGAASGEEALSAIRNEAPPDVILMEMGIAGGMSGIECTKKIREIAPSTKIVMLTAFSDDDRIFEAISSGASGYLLKNSTPEEIVQAVRDAHNGGAAMSPEVAKRVLSMFARSFAPNIELEYDLTKRELEVLRLLVDGFGKREIAEKLFLSFTTIDTHIRNIYAKLHVHSRTEAAVKAIRERLI